MVATENATGPQLPNNTVGLVYENANIFPGKYKCVVSLQIQQKLLQIYIFPDPASSNGAAIDLDVWMDLENALVLQ